MYVVSFYSYKGGVGRTLALMNVATELARDGKRVLIADFDLEAPGYPSYPGFQCSSANPGLLEYVSTYLADNRAPSIEPYLVQCEIGDNPIWLMPGGKQNDASARLAGIDWEHLYAHRHGFLLFEDIKAQWAALKFDYVLIDCRTGHTDIGSICTRQLPDAVAVFFMPDPQNLGGLASIVANIRDEARAPREKEIALHFCPSNVQDLDDEDDLLLESLAKAAQGLRYTATDAVLIPHYNSLEFLKLEPFVLRRPRSKLSRAYQALKRKIASHNTDDRDGAVAWLERAFEDQRNSNLTPDPILLTKIKGDHGKDAEVAWLMAQVCDQSGDEKSALEWLTIAIDGKCREIEHALMRRATIQGRTPTAIADLESFLRSNRATVAPLAYLAIDKLRKFDGDWVSAARSSPLLQHLTTDEKFDLIPRLHYSRDGLAVAAALAEPIWLDETQPELDRERARTQLTLCQIGTQQFAAAMDVMGDRASVMASQDIILLFNYAIAEWGEHGRPPLDVFEAVVNLPPYSLPPNPYIANRHQCFALAYYLLGRRDKAEDHVTISRDRIRNVQNEAFSSWRYVQLGRKAFEDDLTQMQKQARAGALSPPVVQRTA